MKIFLWALKLGAVANLYYLFQSFIGPAASAGTSMLVPARIVFTVLAYRCLFPVRYKDNIVFHNSAFSSVFITRTLATISEIAQIYLLALVIQRANIAQSSGIEALSSLMVVLVVISQFFVWGSILTNRLILFVFEEMGWLIIYGLNTIASAYLLFEFTLSPALTRLLVISLIFGVFYLPWQLFHLRDLFRSAGLQQKMGYAHAQLDFSTGIQNAIRIKRQTTDPEHWGGLIGMMWMAGYWAIVIPAWVYLIISA